MKKLVFNPIFVGATLLLLGCSPSASQLPTGCSSVTVPERTEQVNAQIKSALEEGLGTIEGKWVSIFIPCNTSEEGLAAMQVAIATNLPEDWILMDVEAVPGGSPDNDAAARGRRGAIASIFPKQSAAKGHVMFTLEVTNDLRLVPE